MRIGFLTNCLTEAAKQNGEERFTTLVQVADWARQNGFDDLECGPAIPLERDAFEKEMEEGIRVSALIYCRNYLSTDHEEAEEHIRQLQRRIEFAGDVGIEKVVTSTGIDKTIEEGLYDRDPAVKDRGNLIRRIPVRSLDTFLQTFDPIFELAEKKNVKICFENCPLMGNIAISPVMWRKIFERVGSDKVGIAYDPSHLIWEMIDPYTPLKEFAPRILHFHAKDTRIDRAQLAETGILTDFSWWNYCIPGTGEIDWKRMFGLLKEIGYQGTVSIEHEDAAYAGSVDAVEEGLIRSREYLKAYI